jgi:DNA polymerase III epsilon subunit-like protein
MNNPSIFFDLETTDLNPMGQILNFCFLVVDEDFNITDEFSDLMRITRLQLPNPYAIRANRTDVLSHQKLALLTESDAMLKISEFINRYAANAGDNNVNLIGYNSSGFDLNYLRTSLIRNGIYPYFKVNNRDLMLVSKKLKASSEEFRDLLECCAQSYNQKINLKLETLCRAHGLLEGSQEHESRADVLLTIELAKTYLKKYGIDVRSYEPYEAKVLHEAPEGAVFECGEGSGGYNKRRTLLAFNNKNALWVDLDKFKGLKKKDEDTASAVRWYNYYKTPFFTEGTAVQDEVYLNLAREALSEFRGLTPENYFSDNPCDIEAFIYKISPDRIQQLRSVMTSDERKDDLSPEEMEIITRYKTANYRLGSGEDEAMCIALHNYSLYRYGGRAKTDKNSDDVFQEDVFSSAFHPTFNELVADIDKISNNADQETKSLMDSLRKFYLDSEIYQVAGKELEKIYRSKKS